MQTEIKAKSSVDAATQMITLQPNGNSGWHSYSVLVNVMSGKMTFHDSGDPNCEPVVRNASQAFVDAGEHTHIARNETDKPAIDLVTYFVPVGAALCVDELQPSNCPVFWVDARSVVGVSREGETEMKKNILVFIFFAVGCGTSYAPAPANPGAPETQNATISGQYNLVLTSAEGHGTTNIYTTFLQVGKTFTGGAKTLVCPSNDLPRCEGNDGQVISITPSGTVSGESVSMTISFPNTMGTDTVTMVGTATGTNLAGTYTDSQDDSGTWTARATSSLAGNYSGTFNSTSHPLLIAPTIGMALAQDASFTLKGTANITSWPCISFLSLSGQAIGGALSLTDAANGVHILAIPTDPTGVVFDFNYDFESTAPSCAGDAGRGVMGNNGSFDY